MRSRIACDRATEFAPGASKITMAAASSLLSRERTEYVLAPSSTRATSFSRVSSVPSALRTISPKASGEFSRPWALMEICRAEPAGVGGPPMLPAETSTFCSRIALTMSLADRFRAAAAAGSIHTRIA